MNPRLTIAYVPSSHLDLFWLGNYNTTLERGAHVIKTYLDRCLQSDDETFLLETTVFAEYFLNRYPDYRESLLKLVREGRVEVGAVYVDRWEHLIPGESLIRNIQFGIEWGQEVLGTQLKLVTHPDLPSLVPQTSQIYAQAGVKYYVTSRKVFPHGAMWRHVSPDGSKLLYLNWPHHYIYTPVSSSDLTNASDRWRSAELDVDATREAFPLGVVPVNGGAADLTDPESFKDRYGDYLWNLVNENRQKYPDYDFAYTTPSAVLEPYDDVDGLPERHGEIPSVWGVACDEEVAFFQRNRRLEDALLTAETVAVVASSFGLDWLPESSAEWQGALYESAFYARKDPIATGQEFKELWRMQVFSEDHNGGGYEGALSSFQKRVIQDRATDYANQIIQTSLASVAGQVNTGEAGVLVFNPLGRAWSGPMRLDLPEKLWNVGICLTGDDGQPLPAQVDSKAEGNVSVQVWLESIPSVGYAFLPFANQRAEAQTATATTTRDDRKLRLKTARFSLTIDLESGSLCQLYDHTSHVDWGHSELFNIRAYREVGSDVTLRMDAESEPVGSTTIDVEVTDNGLLFARVQLRKSILDATVTQTITLWSESERVDVDTRIRWWGSHDWQLRLFLPSSDRTADIAYGTPFYGSSWTDVVPDAAPRNPDEILPEDYHCYREIQQWLHVRRSEAGMLLVTSHPGYFYGDDGLAAVLMRTSPSCGDKRFFWENAGEQAYRFSLFPTGPLWQDANPFDLAANVLRVPRHHVVDAQDGGNLPLSQSCLSLDAQTAVLSSVASNQIDGTINIRVFEGAGTTGTVSLKGPLVDEARVELVDLIGHDAQSIASASEYRFELPAWRIQTLRVARNVTLANTK